MTPVCIIWREVCIECCVLQELPLFGCCRIAGLEISHFLCGYFIITPVADRLLVYCQLFYFHCHYQYKTLCHGNYLC